MRISAIRVLPAGYQQYAYIFLNKRNAVYWVVSGNLGIPNKNKNKTRKRIKY